MAVNQDYVGRTFRAPEPYEVSRVKIREFADAIGDPNPVYRDQAAARAAGYRDIIAPPTFPIIITMVSSHGAVFDPGLGLNYAMVVHGEERFTYSRPLQAGDVVLAETTITRIRQAAGLTMITTETEVSTVSGDHVCTAVSTLVERGAQ